MTITFTRTREQLATMILGKLGVLAAGETAPAEDTTLVYEGIDLRLKEMHRLGIFWRKVNKQSLSFTMTANVATASASADVLFPIAMTVRNVSVDDPVDIISIREYSQISNKAESGVPTHALHNGSSSFIMWPVPTATTTVKLIYEKVADDTAASTAPDVEVSMLRWLRDIVAYDLADNFGVEEARIGRLRQEAMYAELQIRKLSVERVDYTPVKVDYF